MLVLILNNLLSLVCLLCVCAKIIPTLYSTALATEFKNIKNVPFKPKPRHKWDFCLKREFEILDFRPTKGVCMLYYEDNYIAPPVFLAKEIGK